MRKVVFSALCSSIIDSPGFTGTKGVCTAGAAVCCGRGACGWTGASGRGLGAAGGTVWWNDFSYWFCISSVLMVVSKWNVLSNESIFCPRIVISGKSSPSSGGVACSITGACGTVLSKCSSSGICPCIGSASSTDASSGAGPKLRGSSSSGRTVDFSIFSKGSATDGWSAGLFNKSTGSGAVSSLAGEISAATGSVGAGSAGISGTGLATISGKGCSSAEFSV